MHLLSVAAFLLLAMGARSAIQAPYQQWVALFPAGYDIGGVSSVADGGAYLLFSREDDETLPVCVRIGGSGQVLWERCFRDEWSSSMEEASIAAASDLGALVGLTVGASQSVNLGCPVSRTNGVIGAEDCWLLRFDRDGSKIWDKTYGGTGYEYVTALRETKDGGFLLLAGSDSDISGNKTAPHYGGDDIWLVRLDPSGNVIWDRSFGGTGSDGPIALELMPDGGCVVMGSSSSGASGNKTNGFTGTWIFRVDANGNKLWEYTQAGNDFGLNLRLLENGRLLVSFLNSILTLDSNGNYIGMQTISPTGTLSATLSGSTTADGGAVGYNRTQSAVVRYNGTNIVWTRPYTNFTHVYAATQTGGFIAAEIYPNFTKAITQLAPDALTAKPLLSFEAGSTSAGMFRFHVHGVTNHAYVVDQSVELGSWTPLVTNMLIGNSFPISVPATNSVRFFRARLSQ